MKKTLTISTGLLIAVLTVQFAYCQKSFEGIVSYSIEYGEMPNMQGMEGMLPKEMKVSLKGKKSRIDQKIGDGGNSIVYDYDKKVAFVASNIMGQKFLINIDEESFNENLEKNKDAKVEYFDEYKEILGYKCQKATVTTEGNTMTIFFTEKIPNYMSQEFMNLKGFPVQYEVSQNGMSMTMTATKIDESSISEDIFTKPSGYNEMNIKEFMSMTGQDFKF